MAGRPSSIPSGPASSVFVPDSALHPQQLPTFATAYFRVATVLDALKAECVWVGLEDPSHLRHVSNGTFEAVGTFTASQGGPTESQYRLQLQYTDDDEWEAVSLTIEHLAY